MTKATKNFYFEEYADPLTGSKITQKK